MRTDATDFDVQHAGFGGAAQSVRAPEARSAGAHAGLDAVFGQTKKKPSEAATMVMKNILIVEDDPIFALDLQNLIWEAGGNPIGPARCLQSALELSSQFRIDLAVVDINLADGRTGLPLAKLLNEGFGVRTVIVSGDVPAPGDLGATEHTYVQKPVPTAVLTEIMAMQRLPKPANDPILGSATAGAA